METDGKGMVLRDLLHNPDNTALPPSSSSSSSSSSSTLHRVSDPPPELQLSPSRLQESCDPAISSEISAIIPLGFAAAAKRTPSPVMAARRSAFGKQDGGDHIEEEEELTQMPQTRVPSTWRKSPTTLSPEYGRLQKESLSYEQSNLDEDRREDGMGRKVTVLPPDLSFQTQAQLFDTGYAQNPKAFSLQQAPPVRFAKGEEFPEGNGASRAPNMHPLEQIEKSLPHKLTLQLWLEEERLLRGQIQAHESDRNRTEHEIYQIVGFDLLFQAIIIAGAAQATVLDCTTAWVPLVLSIAASFATFLAVFRKLEAHDRLSSQLQSEKSDVRTLFECVERLKSLGGLFDLNDVPQSSSAKRPRENRNQTAANKAVEILWSYKFFVLIVLLVFSILAIVSFKKILCSQ